MQPGESITALGRDLYLLARQDTWTFDQLAERLAANVEMVEQQVSALTSIGAVVVQPDGQLSAPSDLVQLVTHHEAELERHVGEARVLRDLLRAARAQDDTAQKRHFLIHHQTADDVRVRMQELERMATSETVSLSPGRAQSPQAIAASRPLNQGSLERGVELRSIYQESFANDSDTLENLRELSGHGGQLRTLPLVPFKMIIIDRSVAIIPSATDDPDPGAYEIHNEVLVALLHDYFERLWAVARVPGQRLRHVDSGPRSEPDMTVRQLLQLLSAGDTDAAAARKLGLSERTVRRLMAGAMKELGATSRLQAGVEAVRRGWL